MLEQHSKHYPLPNAVLGKTSQMVVEKERKYTRQENRTKSFAANSTIHIKTDAESMFNHNKLYAKVFPENT